MGKAAAAHGQHYALAAAWFERPDQSRRQLLDRVRRDERFARE